MENRTLCFPWYYPSTNEDLGQICNPWNTEKFNKIMKEQVPKGHCSHCYPDCTRTKYGTTLDYAEFQNCDIPTLGGESWLCNILHSSTNPAPWVEFAKEEFQGANESVPWYLATNIKSSENTDKRFNNQRSRLGKGNKVKAKELFPLEVKANPFYNAYAKDIGIITVFFSDEEIPQYTTKNVRTLNDFLYEIGGSLGFFMGVSVISIVEFIYWFVFRLLAKVLT